MTDKNYPSELTAEAERLTDKLLLQIKSPTPRASIHNRCMESLQWIQEKSWEATDAKWAEILAAEQDRLEEFRVALAALLEFNEQLCEGRGRVKALPLRRKGPQVAWARVISAK